LGLVDVTRPMCDFVAAVSYITYSLRRVLSYIVVHSITHPRLRGIHSATSDAVRRVRRGGRAEAPASRSLRLSRLRRLLIRVIIAVISLIAVISVRLRRRRVDGLSARDVRLRRRRVDGLSAHDVRRRRWSGVIHRLSMRRVPVRVSHAGLLRVHDDRTPIRPQTSALAPQVLPRLLRERAPRAKQVRPPTALRARPGGRNRISPTRRIPNGRGQNRGPVTDERQLQRRRRARRERAHHLPKHELRARDRAVRPTDRSLTRHTPRRQRHRRHVPIDRHARKPRGLAAQSTSTSTRRVRAARAEIGLKPTRARHLGVIETSRHHLRRRRDVHATERDASPSGARVRARRPVRARLVPFAPVVAALDAASSRAPCRASSSRETCSSTAASRSRARIQTRAVACARARAVRRARGTAARASREASRASSSRAWVMTCTDV